MTYHIFLLFLQKQRIDNVDKNNTNVSSTVYTLLKQKALLETEYNEEKENFKRQMQAIGLERRIKRGDAWHPVRIGRSYYNSLNQLAIEVYRTSDEDIEHNFEFGKPVCFFKVEQDDRLDSATSKTDKHKGFDVITTGMVSYADADLRLVLNNPLHKRLCQSSAHGFNTFHCWRQLTMVTGKYNPCGSFHRNPAGSLKSLCRLVDEESSELLSRHHPVGTAHKGTCNDPCLTEELSIDAAFYLRGTTL